MKKTLGYIPIEKGDDPTKETVVTIEGQTFKLAEVWIPGVNEAMTDLHRTTHFRPMASGQRCGNCAATKDRHKGPQLQCPAKDEKTLPGIKYD